MLTRIILLLGFSLLIGFGVWQYDSYELSGHLESTALEHTEKHLDPNYVCPMHPSVVSNEPGSCPICGMDLEQRKTSFKKNMGVEVSAAMQRSLGVTTSKVEYGPVVEEVYASGLIKRTHQASLNSLNSAVTGTVLKVLYKEGDWVKKGEPLLVIDSLEYKESLNAFIEAHEERRSQDKRQALQRLVILGADKIILGQSLIKRIPGMAMTIDLPVAPKNLNLVATQAGKIENLSVKKGDELKVGTKLLNLIAPKLYEVELHSYSGDANKIVVGNKINLKVPGYSGKVWPGRVLSQHKRISGLDTTIMGVFELPEKLVFDLMFVGGYVAINDDNDVLRIPTSAVIYGEREVRVIRKHENGHFTSLEIELGRQTSDWVEVVSGLKEGGSVVTRGQFMIDSEASLRAGLDRMSEGDDNN